MQLTEHTDHWLPTKVHGEIPLVEGADPEATILEALRKLMTPSQVPDYTHIKYMIKTHEVTAAPTDEMELSTKEKETKTIFFELE